LTTIAWGLVRTDGVLINGIGATINRISAGLYQIILSDNVDDEEMMIVLTPQGLPVRIAATSEGTDSIKMARMFDSAGVAADANFYFKIERLNP
jgi:hypothetical protein